MLATLAGFLALLLGLWLLLLPLLVTELSRPRDSAWGAVVLLLGLVLVTSAERLTGAPMLAVLCGGLLVGRLGSEVAQGRWRALSDEERQALRSSERWSRSLNQLAAIAASLLQSLVTLAVAASAWLAAGRQTRSHGKRWVRADSPAQSSSLADDVAPDVQRDAATQAPVVPVAASDEATPPAPAGDETPQDSTPERSDVRLVDDFHGIDALLAAALEPESRGQAVDAPSEPPVPPSPPVPDPEGSG